MGKWMVCKKFFLHRFCPVLMLFLGLGMNACQAQLLPARGNPSSTPAPADPHWLFINPYIKASRQNDVQTMDKIVAENQKEISTAIDEMIEMSNQIEGKMDVGVAGEEGVFYNSNDYIQAAESMANRYAALSGDNAPAKKAARERLIDRGRDLYLQAQKSRENGGDIQQVRQQVFEALEIFRTLGDPDPEAMALHYIGYLYILDKDKTKGIEYSLQAVEKAEQAGLYDREALILSDMAIFYLLDPQDNDSAWVTINKALLIAQKSGNQDTISQVKETYKKIYGKEP